MVLSPFPEKINSLNFLTHYVMQVFLVLQQVDCILYYIIKAYIIYLLKPLSSINKCNLDFISQTENYCAHRSVQLFNKFVFERTILSYFNSTFAA